MTAMTKCARHACTAVGTQRHRDLPGLYCMPCARRINRANGIEVIDVTVSRETPRRIDPKGQ